MKYRAEIPERIAYAAQMIDELRFVSVKAIPALVKLLRDIGEACAEHGPEQALDDEALCSDEVNAFNFANALLDFPEETDVGNVQVD